jgi:hypothetical protein
MKMGIRLAWPISAAAGAMGEATVVREDYGKAAHDLLRRRVVIDALDLVEARIAKP